MNGNLQRRAWFDARVQRLYFVPACPAPVHAGADLDLDGGTGEVSVGWGWWFCVGENQEFF